MRVIDLLEKKIVMPVSSKVTSGILKNKNLNHLGTGVQAIAYYNQKFPGKVIKTIAITGPGDPSYQFLRLCVNHQDNPYFPKIYAYKQYGMKDTGDREDRYAEIDPEDSPPESSEFQMIVVVEKLHSLTSTHVPLLQSVGILPSDLNTLKYARSTEVRPPLTATKNMFVDQKSRKQLYQMTPDVNLKKALRLLEPLFQKFYPDLRQTNIMVRNSGQPHLVIIDPVC